MAAPMVEAQLGARCRCGRQLLPAAPLSTSGRQESFVIALLSRLSWPVGSACLRGIASRCHTEPVRKGSSAGLPSMCTATCRPSMSAAALEGFGDTHQ